MKILNKLKISVIIPVYNAENTIERCMNSICNQTYINTEILAIDDGSKDKSLDLLYCYGKKDSRVKVITQKNSGPGIARNNGIKNATGDFVVFIDADDYIEAMYFERLAEVVRNTNSDVIFIDAVQESVNGRVICQEKMSSFSNLNKDDLIACQMTGLLPWGGWRKAVRRSLLIKNKITYSEDSVGEEALFSFCMLRVAEKIEFIPLILYHYVNYPNSQSKKGSDDPWGGVVNKIYLYLESVGLLQEYITMLHSFALTSLFVSIFRTSCNHNFWYSRVLCLKLIREYKSNWKDIIIYTKSLKPEIRIMMIFVRLNIIIPMILISKIKYFYNQVKNRY